MKMSTYDNKTCRLCLKKRRNLIELFVRLENRLVADTVKEICEIEVSKSEEVNKICNECFYVISKAKNLKDLAKQNDLLIKGLLGCKNEPESQNSNEPDHVFCEVNVKCENFPSEKAIVIEQILEPKIETSEMIYEKNEENASSVVQNAGKIQCKLCNKFFLHERSYKGHMRKIHILRSIKGSYKCDHCNKQIYSKKYLESHMKIFHMKDGKKFVDVMSSIQQYSDKIQEIPKPAFKCTGCEFRDPNFDVILKHLPVHEKVMETGKLFCSLCNVSAIRDMEFMIEHTKSHNKKLRTHQCLTCKKEYAMDEELLKHLRYHEGREARSRSCTQCNKKFSSEQTLEVHIRYVHNKEQLFCCPQCGKGYGSQSTMTKHLKWHDLKDQFECPFCPKKFFSINQLNKHKNTHSNLRSHECNLCSKMFKDNEALRRHVRRHEGKLKNKEYPCEVCGRNLGSTFALSTHMLTHTGVKPHQCQYCHKAYAQNSDLNKHLRTHVGENTYFCTHEGCPESFRLLEDLRVHQCVHLVN